MAAVAAYAMATGGFASAFAGVLLFAATMAALMVLVSLMVGLTTSSTLRRIKGSARPIQRVGSVVMLLVGAGLIYTTLQPDAFQSIFFPG